MAFSPHILPISGNDNTSLTQLSQVFVCHSNWFSYVDHTANGNYPPPRGPRYLHTWFSAGGPVWKIRKPTSALCVCLKMWAPSFLLWSLVGMPSPLLWTISFLLEPKAKIGSSVSSSWLWYFTTTMEKQIIQITTHWCMDSTPGLTFESLRQPLTRIAVSSLCLPDNPLGLT